ncbi:MAG TPA: tetratricopeptide repeat-containing sensor histidine kinase, partial [Cyclobacteriaceae bacterium]|nr:tetratricopeptide repeat-containing sensor histidine kinase [Cyclobacteriaceae bacterium]
MKYTNCIGSLLLYLCMLNAEGQNNIDSLQRQLGKELTDSVRVNVMLALSQALYNHDLKKSLSHAQEALKLAEKKADDQGVQKALSIMSRIQRRLGNFSVAVEYNLRELTIAEKRNDKLGMIDSYTTLGNIHSSLENYQEAKRNLSQAYTIAQSINAPNLSSIMNFIGRNYGKMNQYDSAEYWIASALAYETKFPTKGYALSYIYNNLAEIYFFQTRYSKALEYYQFSMALPENKKSPFGKTFTLNGLARTYKELKRYNEAIHSALESITISREFSYRDKAKESYGILYEIYEEMNDYRNALANYKLFNLYQDSIFSEDNLQYIENLKIQYEMESVTTENELLKKDAELKDSRLSHQKNLTLAWIVIVLSLVGAVSFLYYGYQQKKTTNQILAEYNKNLATQVKERTQELVKTNFELIRQNNQLEQYGYITAHNLRSPVARIMGLTSLLNIGAFDPVTDAHIIEKLRFTAAELDTIIHDMNAILDIKNGIENSYEPVYFNERLEKIKSILKESIAAAQASIESDFSAVKSCLSVPAYIESIFYNLISNAIKYRSPDRKPEIKIKSGIRADKLELTISDNGMGIDLSLLKDKIFNLYQRFHAHIEGKGMGLFLVKTQVEALNGTIEIESTVNRGTTFHIVLPL